MITPALTRVEEIVYDVASGDETPTHALAEIRNLGGTYDPAALDEAVDLLRKRDDFEAGIGNPYEFVGVDGPRQPSGSMWDAAVAKAEEELSWCVRRLAARPATAARAS